VYYLHGVPSGGARGGHAHRNLEQLLIPVAGSLQVLLDDGEKQEVVNLHKPNVGLHLRSMVWRELIGFDEGTICLVLASEHFDESDYIRDYKAFQSAALGAE
jgi:hypothetical protein